MTKLPTTRKRISNGNNQKESNKNNDLKKKNNECALQCQNTIIRYITNMTTIQYYVFYEIHHIYTTNQHHSFKMAEHVCNLGGTHSLSNTVFQLISLATCGLVYHFCHVLYLQHPIEKDLQMAKSGMHLLGWLVIQFIFILGHHNQSTYCSSSSCEMEHLSPTIKFHYRFLYSLAFHIPLHILLYYYILLSSKKGENDHTTNVPSTIYIFHSQIFCNRQSLCEYRY